MDNSQAILRLRSLLQDLEEQGFRVDEEVRIHIRNTAGLAGIVQLSLTGHGSELSAESVDPAFERLCTIHRLKTNTLIGAE